MATKTKSAVSKLQGMNDILAGVRNDIDAIRLRISEIDQEISTVRRAPMALDEIKARITSIIERHRQSYISGFPARSLILEGGVFDLSDVNLSAARATVLNRRDESESADTLPVSVADHSRQTAFEQACALQPEAVEAFMLAQAESALQACPEAPLSRAERASKLATLEQERFALEHQEETTIVAAEQAGFNVARRSNCNVEIFLEINDEQAPIAA